MLFRAPGFGTTAEWWYIAYGAAANTPGTRDPISSGRKGRAEGVATACGACVVPGPTLDLLITWVLVFMVFRYVSVASPRATPALLVAIVVSRD